MFAFGTRLRNLSARINNFVVYRVLRADDGPHRLALGLALGIFITWTPTIGFQMMLVLLLAPLVRANARVGLPLVWLSNPLTLVPIYYPNYMLGRLLVELVAERESGQASFDQIREALGGMSGLGAIIENLLDVEMWRQIGGALWVLGLDLWVGSIAMGLILGVVTYVAGFYGIVWYRSRHPQGWGDPATPREAGRDGDLS